MDNVTKIITFVIAALVGAVFLYWGIYQLKTGKMVAKRAKKPIDEPKQVGLTFIMLGFAGICLAFICANFAPLLTTVISLLFLLPCSLFFILIAIYGFKYQRIFGIKDTPKLHKIVQKFYKAINVLFIVISAAIISLVICGNIFSKVSYFAITVMVIICAIIAGCLLKINSEFKKS